MTSKQKTPVAVLRLIVGLTVEQFAKLIGKSLVTINSLETGRLKLSEETAIKIANQTGVALLWLLTNDPKKPPFSYDRSGEKIPYSKEIFEEVRAQLHYEKSDSPSHLRALVSATDWLSIYAAAARIGKGELALYLFDKYLNELSERFNPDLHSHAA